MSERAYISVEGLSIAVAAGGSKIIDDVSFEVHAGEVVAIVGESGSGKSTLGLSLLGHTRAGLQFAGGAINVGDQNVASLKKAELGRVRGRVVSYIPQDASVSLDPSCRIGKLMDELLRTHAPELDKAARMQRILTTLEEVHLPADRLFIKRFVHQLSGGQQQRLGIALALVVEPTALVLDEPTTGLDALTQRGILAAVGKATKARNAAAVFITHDLEVVSSIADRVLVLYAGRIAEYGPRGEILKAPAHPYTRGLIQSAPRIDKGVQLRGIAGSAPAASDRPSGCAFHPRCPVAGPECSETQPQLRELTDGHQIACHRPQLGGLVELNPRPSQEPEPSEASQLCASALEISYGRNKVVHGVDLAVSSGKCMALVGASGSGKTSVSRAMVGLVAPSAGVITLDGRDLAGSVDKRSDEARRALQYIFQNPYGSLNPRKTIIELLEQPARAFGLTYSRAVATEWLERVTLSPRVLDRRPDALSGGERQRVAIARAIACDPRFLICDEITAPLDVSVQATIVELIRNIIVETGLGVLFVTHDLGVVRSLADEVAIFQDGTCIERGSTDGIFEHPTTDYARDLVAAAGSLSGA